MEKLLDIVLKLLPFYKKDSLTDRIEKDKHISYLQDQIDQNKLGNDPNYYKREQFKYKYGIDTCPEFSKKLIELLNALGHKFTMEHLKNVFSSLEDLQEKNEAVLRYSKISQVGLKWLLRYFIILFFCAAIGMFVIPFFFEEYLLFSMLLFFSALFTGILVFVLNYSDYRIYLMKIELEKKGRQDLLRRF